MASDRSADQRPIPPAVIMTPVQKIPGSGPHAITREPMIMKMREPRITTRSLVMEETLRFAKRWYRYGRAKIKMTKLATEPIGMRNEA